MASQTLTLVGIALWLLALFIAWRAWAKHAPAWVGQPEPWVPTWSASTGSGCNGAPRLTPRPNPLTVEHIEARRTKIIKWLRRFDVPRSEEEDLAQRVIGEAWCARDTYRPALAELDTWLYSLTRNWASNYMKSAWARRVELGGFDSSSPILVTDETPETDFERAELAQIARTILARLPARLAEIWTRFEGEGEEARDIAVALGIPLSTTWGHLQQARERIACEVAPEKAIEAHTSRRRWLGRPVKDPGRARR